MNRVKIITLIMMLALIVILLAATESPAQEKWSLATPQEKEILKRDLADVKAYASGGIMFIIHPVSHDIHRILSDNLWRVGAQKGRHWRLAYYRSGHRNWFFHSDPTTNGIRNRNSQGLYFQHPIPWISNHLKKADLSVGHMLGIVGDDIGQKGTAWRDWIIMVNVSVPIYESGKFSVNLGTYATSKFKCYTQGVEISVTF